MDVSSGTKSGLSMYLPIQRSFDFQQAEREAKRVAPRGTSSFLQPAEQTRSGWRRTGAQTGAARLACASRSASLWPVASGAGGAAWDPGGAEWRTAESTGLQRRNAASTSGWCGDGTRAEEQRVPRLFGDSTREKFCVATALASAMRIIF